MNIRAKSAIVVGIGSILCAGCGAPSVDDAAIDGEDVDTTFTRTIVEAHEDGTETVTVDHVTLAQQIEEREAEEASILAGGKLGSQSQAIGVGGCGTGTLRIWSGTNFTGDLICFYGTGLAAIGSYCRVYVSASGGPPGCFDYWDGNVKSVKTGDYAVLFTGDVDGFCVNCTKRYEANQFVTSTANAGACIPNVKSLYRDVDPDCPPE